NHAQPDFRVRRQINEITYRLPQPHAIQPPLPDLLLGIHPTSLFHRLRNWRRQPSSRTPSEAELHRRSCDSSCSTLAGRIRPEAQTDPSPPLAPWGSSGGNEDRQAALSRP